MQKYGIEHFHIEMIEETDIPEEREKYWIEYFDSFRKGYNATLGGDGKTLIDHSKVVEVYNKLLNVSETARQLKISQDSVMDILDKNNIKRCTCGEVTAEKMGIKVDMFTLNGEYLNSFLNMSCAARYIIQNNLSKAKESSIRQHISEVCKNKRKTAYGFIWKFSAEMVE